ncbi:MAG TPA: 3-dehydroquinate synthase [Patescibacteria group bacterium]
MHKIKLKFSSEKHEYSIYIGKNLLEKLNELLDLKKYSQIVVLTDTNIAPHFLNSVIQSLPKNTKQLILPAGEKNKNIEHVQKIWKFLQASNFDRKSLVINLGGGVITDMGGFAASTYMRGIDFINLPTTLLSQVDASIGGKTGIDFANVKNLIGTFNQPKAVIIDIQTLKSLPEREYRSGFAEIIKHGIIADKNYFAKVTNKKPLDFNSEELIDIIARSCEIKKSITTNDETENNARKLLNFGHTIGHAIEALSLDTDKPLLHGEAISIGMVAEAKIAELTQLIDGTTFEMIKTKLQEAELPVAISEYNSDQIISKMRTDKKNERGEINFTLIKNIGKGIVGQTVDDQIILKSLDYVL